MGLLLIAPACSKASNETTSDFEPAEDPGAVVFADPSPDVTATPPAAKKTASTSTGSSSSAPAAAPAPVQEGRVSCPVGPVVAEVTDVTSDEMTPDPDDPPPPGQDLWRVRVTGTARNNSNGPVSDVVVRVEIHPSGSEGESESAYLAGPFGPGSVVQWSVTEEVYSEDDVETNDVRASVRSWSWGDRAKDANCGH